MAQPVYLSYGMSKDFDMVALETVNNQYLGGDTSLACFRGYADCVEGAVEKGVLVARCV